jgi:hypothetical protein
MGSEELPRVWVKPVRRRTIEEVKALIIERQREVAALELELFNMQQGRVSKRWRSSATSCGRSN